MVNTFTANSQASYGNSKIDSLSCNSVGVGCTRDSADPGTATSRLVMCRSNATNGGENLLDICDENGDSHIFVDKDLNFVISTSSSTHGFKFTATMGQGGVFYPAIVPTATLTGSLGQSNLKFWDIYSHILNVSGSSSAAYITNAYITNTHSWSDERIKSNIVTADSSQCMSNVRAIELKDYEYDGSYVETPGEKVRGVIAQQLKTVLPHAVKVGSGLLGDGTEVDDFHYVRKNFIFMELLGAVKHLDSLVTSQATEIAGLKSRIEVLEG